MCDEEDDEWYTLDFVWNRMNEYLGAKQIIQLCIDQKSPGGPLHPSDRDTCIFLWKPGIEIMEAKSLTYLKIIPINRYSLHLSLLRSVFVSLLPRFYGHIFFAPPEIIYFRWRSGNSEEKREGETEGDRESVGADRSVSIFRSRGQLWSAYSSANWAKKAPNLNRGPNNCVIE